MWRRWIAALLVAPLAVAGCADSRRAPQPGAVVEVTVLTGFGMLPQDAALFLAERNGYFAAAGLKVTVRPGKGTADNIGVLLGGQADFAVVDLTGAIIQIPKISEGGVRAVAAIYQRSISTITALPGSGIDRPVDLEGKTVGYQPGGVNHTLFPAYASKTGIDASKVQWRQLRPDQIRGALAAGTVDAVTETVIGTPGVKAVAQGRDPVVLPYGDVLADLYGNVVITSTDILDTDPDLVARFRTAVLRGLTDAINDPAAAAAVFVTGNPQFKVESAAEEIALMAAYVRGGAEIGALDPTKVMRSIVLLQGVSAVPPERQLQPHDVIHIPCPAGSSPGRSCT